MDNSENNIENTEIENEDTSPGITEETKEAKETKQPRLVRKSSAVIAAVVSAFVAALITLQAVFGATYMKNMMEQRKIYGAYADELENAYKSAGDFSKLSEMKNYIDETYIYDYDSDMLMRQLEYYLISGTGDRFASYYTKEEWEASSAEGAGKGVGIGVYAISKNDGIYIAYVMGGSPAEAYGIEEGDTIIAIDGHKISDIGYSAGIAAIAGEIGTSVTLTVLRGGEETEIVVVRSNYIIETVIAGTLDGEQGKLGYVRVIEFDKATTEQFKSAVSGLLREGCEGLIFDMRDNPGGDLDVIVDIVDYLVPSGPIVHLTDLDGNEVETYYSGSTYINCPMVVLTNGGTASAAEIFTSSLRDYEMATVVGEKTYGKGCCQTGTMLSDGSVLFVTAYLYDPPFSANYDGVGIYPDIEVATPEEFRDKSIFYIGYEDDVQLHAAINELYNLCK